MVTRYCDHGLYSTPVAGGTVPTAAEDGNGKAKTAATMATLIVAFSGLPAPDQAITIAGVTFTAKASGATGNQFNIGADATATATNLKTAINASRTNAVQPSGALAAAAPLRNIVNACSSGGTVTVYTRCSGSEWNSVTENSTLGNCSVTQWSGGADGAYGYFANPAAIAWPDSQAIGSYGILGVASPYFKFDAGDIIKVRGGKTISFNTPASTWSWTSLPTGSSAQPTVIEFDDGTEWAGDSSTSVFTLQVRYLGGILDIKTQSAVVFRGKRYADGSCRFNIDHAFPYPITLHFASSQEYTGVLFSSTYGFTFNSSGGEATADAVHVKECRVVAPNAGTWIGFNDSLGSKTVFWSDTEFSCAGSSSPCTGFFSVANYSQRYNMYFESCEFTNFVPGSKLYIPAAKDARVINLFFRNCVFGGMSVLGPNVATWTVGNIFNLLAISSQYENRDFAIDTMFGFVEWNSNRSFPYCNARLLDGVTGWSIHVIPTTQPGRNSRFQFVETPRISKINSLADGVRTLTIPLAIHESLAWNKSHISAVIDYIDTNGNRQVVDTYDYAGSALAASGDTWSQEVGGQVTYVDGSTQYHNKYEFSVTTPTAIATGTEIGIVIRCHAHVPDTTKGLFIDPEIQVV